MSRRGHLPIRMCIGCRKRRKKGEMVRFIHIVKDGVPLLGRQKQGGKGVYVCPDASCLKMARKRFLFDPSIDIRPFYKNFEDREEGRKRN